MLKNILENITQKIEQQKTEMDNYNNLVDTTTTFKNLFPIPTNINKETSTYKINYIQNNCPDINKEKAILKDKIIPIEETYLNVYYAKEILTNLEYYIIPTNKYLWIINTTSYGAFNYQDIKTAIIKNNIMSKVIILNNILLEITGNNKINLLVDIINNQETRINTIKEKTTHLCGITPNYQILNSNGYGITIDKENNIVFHNNTENIKETINNIENYELLLDNQTIYSKNNSTTNKLTSFITSCYNISIRITLKDTKVIIIPILEPNSLGTKYNSHDMTYQENIEIAKKIINIIKEIQDKKS